MPASLVGGDPALLSYAATNVGVAAVSGKTWTDAIYLSRDTYLDTNDRLLGSVQLSATVAPDGIYTNTIPVTIPLTDEGAYYLILSVDDAWQVLDARRANGELALPANVLVPALTDGVPKTGNLKGNGADR